MTQINVIQSLGCEETARLGYAQLVVTQVYELQIGSEAEHVFADRLNHTSRLAISRNSQVNDSSLNTVASV